MRKLILTLAVVCSFGIAGAVAQSSTAQSDQQPTQSTTTTQTSTTNQNSTSTTGAMNSGQSSTLSNSQSASTPPNMAANQGSDIVEGCLIREQANYFIQPISGGARTQVSGTDLDSHVGQNVRLHGSGSSQSTAGQNGSLNSQNTSSGMNSNPQGVGSTSGNPPMNNGTFMVTKVDTISATCSPNSTNNTPQP